MFRSILGSVLVAFTGLAPVGCASTAESTSDVAQVADLSTSHVTTYRGRIDVGGETLAIALRLTAEVPAATTERIDCWAHAGNEPLCTLWFDGHAGTLQSELTVTDAGGGVLVTRSEGRPTFQGGRYLSPDVSASFLQKPGASALTEVDVAVAVAGVTATSSRGPSLRMPQGYGAPGTLELPALLALRDVEGSFADNSTGQTRLSSHRFQGRPELRFPESVSVTVGVIARPAELMGTSRSVVLQRDDGR